MSNKNEVFEYLIDQLRQQVNKKDVTSFDVSVRVSDLDEVKQVIHNLHQHIAGKDDEIRVLKDRLRDASAQIKELYEALDVALKYSRKFREEQSGYRKEDTQGCEHDWVLDEKGDYFVCTKCGKQEAELNDCQHTNTVGLRKGFAPGFTKKCLNCGAKLK